MKNLRIIPALLFILFLGNCSDKKVTPEPNYVVVVSLDGFRWDYTETANTPVMDSIAKTGVKAKSLIPSFPSKTFPNHYTLATGLYPNHHGIVQNSFYDPELDRYYEIRNREAVSDSSFYGGEPIWVSAEKQGVKTASFYWVGSEAPVGGIHPTYWKKYKHNFPFEQRIDTVISWLNLPEEIRPRLVMLYFHEPDHVGHVFGPDSDSVKVTVEYLDSLMGVLSKKINSLEIAAKINLIILSDHGMGWVDPEKTVFLADHIDTNWFETIQGWNPNFCLKVKPEYYDTAYNSLKKIPHIQVWEHGEVPERLHYGTHPRTLDFIVVADPGCGVTLKKGFYQSLGAHGYDNFHRDMHAIFMASGPDFRKGYFAYSFSNIHVYPLLANILGITPAPTDGNSDSIQVLLNPQKCSDK